MVETDYTITADSEPKSRELVKKKQAHNKLTGDLNTNVDIKGIGLAEVKLTEDEGYLPAIQFSINGVSQTGFLETHLQSKKEALRKISDITNLKSKDNVFVRSNNIYLRSFHFEMDDSTKWVISILLALTLPMTTLFFLVVLGLVRGPIARALGVFGAACIPVVVFVCFGFIRHHISREEKVCDFKTSYSTNGTINEFIDYKNDNLFESSQRVVEVSARDDNGLRVETAEGDIIWTIEGRRGLPTEDLLKYQIGDNDNDIRYAEKALVKENDGSDGLVSECGDYVIPTK